MKPLICIHGHFYQPPRENPWLDAMEKEFSADPYHDWNERISAECYSQNAYSRILNSKKLITRMINNYSYISFNIGPTLFRWLEKNDIETYQSILEADMIAQGRFSGHGSAIAQVYNHIIMPLANRRDKSTQVKWGVQDFVYRFKRYPEGMWLAETAVDIETLEVLAENGIKFTILAPHQAKKIRLIDGGEWIDLKSHEVDTSRAYLCNLPSGKKINLFFYNGGLSHAIGFGNLLNDGKTLAERLIQAGGGGNDGPKLVHVAVDGETFGHHHKFGDMAIAYCVSHIMDYDEADITVYGEYLEKYPAKFEVEINENTSWSCAHGIERWRSDCGCNSGSQPGWNQAWRTPLRESLDWLRDEINHHFEKKAGSIIADPWQARDEYISLVLNRDPENVQKFTSSVDRRKETHESSIIMLFELQKFMMMMYTSCGWFFDDITGLESRLLLRFAIRVTQLAEVLFGVNLEPDFIARMEKAHSNLIEFKSGGELLRKSIVNEKIDPLRTAVYFAISLLFENSFDKIEKFHYDILNYRINREELAGITLLVGEMKIRDTLTYEITEATFCVKNDESYDIFTYIMQGKPGELDELISKIGNIAKTRESHKLGEFLELVFDNKYSLQHVFRDKQYEISNKILREAINDLEKTQNVIFTKSYRVINFFKTHSLTLPKQIVEVIENSIVERLVRLFKEDEIDTKKLIKYINRAKKFYVRLHLEELEISASNKIHDLLKRIYREDDFDLMEKILDTLEILSSSSLELNVCKAQNIYYKIWMEKYPRKITEAIKQMHKLEEGRLQSETHSLWIDLFHKIGKNLRMAIN